MLRLIHKQVNLGAILVDDIDDGLPNKTVHRMGTVGDPKAYPRDGYANKAKQQCYIPHNKPTDPTLPGFIDVFETDRVTHSAGKGKISGLQRAGLIDVTVFSESDIGTPAVTLAALGVPGAGDLTITGTKLLSLAPDYTSVVITGTGAVTLTQADILAAAGTISDTSIFIPAALVPGIAAATSFVVVHADDKLSTPALAVS
jgi:riboflavin synthase